MTPRITRCLAPCKRILLQIPFKLFSQFISLSYSQEPVLDHFLNQMNRKHRLALHFLKIYFRIILLSWLMFYSNLRPSSIHLSHKWHGFHHFFHNLITIMTFDKAYKIWKSSLFSFLFSILFSKNIYILLLECRVTKPHSRSKEEKNFIF
jgi:hypothetical protein